MEYGDVLFIGCSIKDSNKLNYVEREAMRIVSAAIARSNSELLKIELKWEQLETRQRNHSLVILFKIMNDNGSISLKNQFDEFYNNKSDRSLNLRTINNIPIPLYFYD